MKIISSLLALLFFTSVNAQPLKQKNSQAGIFSLGVRTSIGLVNDGQWQRTAFGTGGQFRIQFSDRVNTEWFADHLKADLSDYAWRADTHIGWSVMYYLTKQPQTLVRPYILAGHCFEYLKFTDNTDDSNIAERWSASVQGGMGAQFTITQRLDLSLAAQYMLHLGTKIKADNAEGVTTFSKSEGLGIHDHILLHLSINYKIADLW
ncbi:MAG TPA: outer membrane beta-barrel protein [Bacteroidales bacterium]|nr:outer membrane beta-barrel protein [Bacteroidales bacterium]HPS26858.1 outer membrane beta-barrel protein [Bacteroidales bacterium]